MDKAKPIIEQSWSYSTWAPFAIAFVCGLLAGFVTFATDFTDRPGALLKSFWVYAYAFLSGGMGLLVFVLAQLCEIKILSLSFSDHPFLLAGLTGFFWLHILLHLEPETSTPQHFSLRLLPGTFHKVKAYFYHHYSVKLLLELRLDVWKIIKDIKDENFYTFFTRCLSLSGEINSEKMGKLGEQYQKYQATQSSISDYKCTLAANVARFLGISLLEQVAKEVAYQPGVPEKIKGLDTLMRELDTIMKKDVSEIGAEGEAENG